MRMIPKLQTGFVPLHYQHVAPTQQVSAATAQPAADTTSGKKDDEILSESMLKFIIEKALPNDATKFIHEASIFGSNILGGMSMGSSVGSMKEMLLYLNRMHHEKTMYDNSIKLIEKIGGTGEAAISTNGGVFVLRNNKLQEVRVKDLRKGENPLTNSQIANIRANSSKYAFNTGLTSALNNATSMSEIQKVIDANLANLGSDKSTIELIMSGTNPSKESLVIKAFASSDITINDLASFSTDALLTRIATTETNAKLLKKALTSIYSLLDNNMQVLMLVRARLLSLATGSNIDVLGILAEYISSKTKNEVSYTMDIKSVPGRDSGDGSSSNSDSLDKLPFNATVAALAGMSLREWVTLSPGTEGEIRSKATIGLLTDGLGNSLGQTPLSEILKSALSGVLNTDSATFAGIKINPAQFSSIMLNNPQYHMLDLPIDMVEFNKTGTIKPDLELTSKINVIEDEIRTKGITDINLINALYKNAGLPVKYTGRDALNNPILNIQYYRKFAAVDVVADLKGLPTGVDFDDYEHLILLVNDDSIVDNLLNILSKEHRKFSPSTSIFGNDIWKGVMYIPVRDYMTNAYLGSTNNINVGQALNLDLKSLYSERSKYITSAYNQSSPSDIGLNY